MRLLLCFLTAALLGACNDPSGDPATTDKDSFYPADVGRTRGIDDTLNVPDSSARTVTQ